jgi:integrase
MAGRRGNNEGTIRKRSDGRWEGRVALPDGKSKSYYGKTRQEVARRLNQAIRDTEQGLPLPSERQTVEQFLTAWLEIKRPKVEHNSYLVYETAVRRYIAPVLGAIPLAKLTAQQIETMYARECEKLSPNTVQKHHNVLRQALKHAVRLGLIQRNPVDLVEPPSGKRSVIQVLTEEQSKKFLQQAQGTRLEALYWLALSTGMRQGELLGLQWSSVDLDQGIVRVVNSVKRRDGKLYLGHPKTKSSRRNIFISSSITSMLRAHRSRQEDERQGYGLDWNNSLDLVFPRQGGFILAQQTLTESFKRILRQAGLPGIRFHDLRHTAATLLLCRGVNVKVVSEMLGHSSATMTLNVYAHVLPTMQQQAAEIMQQVLG